VGDQPFAFSDWALKAFGFSKYAALAEVFLNRSMVGVPFVLGLDFDSAGMLKA
jgi:hypothetical protein